MDDWEKFNTGNSDNLSQGVNSDNPANSDISNSGFNTGFDHYSAADANRQTGSFSESGTYGANSGNTRGNEYGYSNASGNSSSAFASGNSGSSNTSGNNENGTTYTYKASDAPKRVKRAKKEKKPKQPIVMTKGGIALLLVCCIICSAAIGAAAYALAMSTFGGTTIDHSVKTTNYSLVSATGSELSIEEIAAMNQGSVVAISTESISTDSWLGQYVTEGAGSGVVYSEDGYIVTNNHVIKGATNIKVTMSDGTEYDAKLVATDTQTDVAVLKIDAKNLVPVKIGDMNTVSVGDLAVAIGNPLGTLAGTVTTGIVSALEREITLDNQTMTLIQTDTAVNPGNSGGGLFDEYGNLIGLVVAKSSGSSVEGLGFAIPCDRVKAVADELIENGFVAGRPMAGISILDLTDASTAMKYGVSIAGVYITEVTGTNAKKAGLKAGDLVYYLDDTKITSSALLISEIQKHEIGDVVTFTVVRDNEIVKIDLELEAKVQTEEKSADTSDSSQNTLPGGTPDSEYKDPDQGSGPNSGSGNGGFGDFWGSIFGY